MFCFGAMDIPIAPCVGNLSVKRYPIKRIEVRKEIALCYVRRICEFATDPHFVGLSGLGVCAYCRGRIDLGKDRSQLLIEVLAVSDEARKLQEDQRHALLYTGMNDLVESHRQQARLIDRVQRIDGAPWHDSPRVPACQFTGNIFVPETRAQFVYYPARGCFHNIPHGDDNGVNLDIVAREQFVDKFIKPWGLDDVGKISVACRKILKSSIGILIEPIFRISREVGIEAARREVLDQKACTGTTGSGDEKVVFQFL